MVIIIESKKMKNNTKDIRNIIIIQIDKKIVRQNEEYNNIVMI